MNLIIDWRSLVNSYLTHFRWENHLYMVEADACCFVQWANHSFTFHSGCRLQAKTSILRSCHLLLILADHHRPTESSVPQNYLQVSPLLMHMHCIFCLWSAMSTFPLYCIQHDQFGISVIDFTFLIFVWYLRWDQTLSEKVNHLQMIHSLSRQCCHCGVFQQSGA